MERDKNNKERYAAIGRTIQKYRKEHGWTQVQFAEMVPMGYSFLTQIEAQNCDKPFSLDILFAIADALGIHPAELLEDIE